MMLKECSLAAFAALLTRGEHCSVTLQLSLILDYDIAVNGGMEILGLRPEPMAMVPN